MQAPVDSNVGMGRIATQTEGRGHRAAEGGGRPEVPNPTSTVGAEVETEVGPAAAGGAAPTNRVEGEKSAPKQVRPETAPSAVRASALLATPSTPWPDLDPEIWQAMNAVVPERGDGWKKARLLALAADLRLNAWPAPSSPEGIVLLNEIASLAVPRG
jgi:hypothetical protein